MNNHCALCPNTHRQVFSSGPTPSRYALIGEGPGFKEDKFGMPFVGPSGQELDNTYLRLAGIDRSEVFVTNAVQCRCERNGNDVRPSPKLVESCSWNHLPQEIEICSSDIVFLAGATACSLIGGIDLELEHGIPRQVDRVDIFGGWSGWVVPMYHPAAGLREAKYMITSLVDWENIGLWLRGKWVPPTPPTLPTTYTLARTALQVDEYFDMLSQPDL